MTKRDQEALEEARAEIEKLFPASQILPVETLLREKEQSRIRDQDRMAEGEATPEQIQDENSILTAAQAKSIKILNLEETLAKLT